jgi:phosphoglycolate phosphatase
MSKIFFDLDGTLIDSKQRLYSLFKELTPKSNLTFDEYWQLKSSKIDHRAILTEKFGYTEELFVDFEKKWLNLIETKKYLEMDSVFIGVQDSLNELKQNFTLNLITARQSVEMVHWQLKNTGLYNFFDNIFVTEHKASKESLILQYCSISNIDYYVGDTGYDILTGKKCGLKTIAVSYGFLSREKLLEYNPDFITDNFPTVRDIIIYGAN